MDYNQKQQKIINELEGVFIIGAPVGTGKTTILGARVKKALESGMGGEEILCLTFTNRAAEEMRDRLKKDIPDKSVLDKITIKTFHGFCAYFIRAEADAAGVSSDFVIFDENDRNDVMREAARQVGGYSEDELEDKDFYYKIFDKVYRYKIDTIKAEHGWPEDLTSGKSNGAGEISEVYSSLLASQNALDFDELVCFTLRVLLGDEKIRDKWSSRYKLIQVDEFQDTHISEYLIIKELAKTHGNLIFVGDLDQTIYRWRGSDPVFIKRLITHHFPNTVFMDLDKNYRFNPHLLKAVRSFLGSIRDRATGKLDSYRAGDGADVEKKCIKLFDAYSWEEEISWIIDNIKNIRREEPDASVAVLLRMNFLISQMAERFSAAGIAHITVDKFAFFRKQVVKDVYAYLRIIFNRFDTESAYRLIKRPPRNIGPATLDAIRKEGGPAGLKIPDLLDMGNYGFDEPFSDLIGNWREGRIVVLDTETTGTNVVRDEIIQIYAIEVVAGKAGKDFHFYLKNTIPVGSSQKVHGISDEFLVREGREPKEVLSELKDFIGDSPIAGHNVVFDISQIEEDGKKHGVDLNMERYYDTLDLSRRLIRSDSYKLTVLADKLGLATATHDARDDVMATVGLLGELVGRLKGGSAKRAEIFGKYKPKFIKLANSISRWRKQVLSKRPYELLEVVWEESGLAEFYQREEKSEERINTYSQLLKLFKDKDDPGRRGDEVLRDLLHYASFNKGIDFLGLESGEIPVITPHQAKGLEFDHVFIPYLIEGKFPNYRSDREEEKKLFYVGLTRARKRIFLSFSRFDKYGNPRAKSRFIDHINREFIE